jgi:choline kinase/thiamine kinase-like enzyme
MKRTVVIPAAGLGARLGDFTKNYSKAMCTLGKKPIISHIIEKFDDNDEIIILTGYKGNLLKECVESCHPNKNIRFVDVDVFEGPGSGLGYSLHCAYEFLQKPFIFWSCDTVTEKFDLDSVSYDTNWMVAGTSHNEYFDNYRHIRVNDKNEVREILPKLIKPSKGVFCYTGIAFIKDYKQFWETYGQGFIENGEAYGLTNLSNIKAYFIEDWIDTGNRTIFEEAKHVFSSRMEEVILEKPDEAIWFIDNRVIKFHISEKFIADRVERFKTLLTEKQNNAGILLPKILSHNTHTYVYQRADGEIASKGITASKMLDIISRYLDNIETVELTDDEKIAIYKDFYLDKTVSRIKKYCADFSDIDKDDVYINGVKCQSAQRLVETINWEQLALEGVFTNNYHGDFHLENILIDGDKYIMLDWRQNFGKTMVGDAYYDIAKMWHSLIVNHNMVHADLFSVENISPNEVIIDIHRTFIDCECERALIEYLLHSDYSFRQADLMTAIIFLNIAACHIYPYSKFLFNLGKYMINICYKNYSDKFWTL